MKRFLKLYLVILQKLVSVHGMALGVFFGFTFLRNEYNSLT